MYNYDFCMTVKKQQFFLLLNSVEANSIKDDLGEEMFDFITLA